MSELKHKAIGLLALLCHTIDGLLPRLAQTLMIAIDSVLLTE
jgi:hypothetical protein